MVKQIVGIDIIAILHGWGESAHTYFVSLRRYVARSQPFALQISKWLFLAWTLIRRQNLSFSVTKVNSKTVNEERSATVGCNSITFLKNYSV